MLPSAGINLHNDIKRPLSVKYVLQYIGGLSPGEYVFS